MLRSIETYYLLFMIYAIFGWIIEVVGKYFEYHRFINRGFLIGPYCPIYGWGALAISLLLHKYVDDPIALFVMAMVVCSILEYLTSYIMEKLFNARWWDYSQRRFNINGRICLNTMIPFGLLGVFVLCIANPFILSIINKIPDKILLLISLIVFLIYLTDNILSFIILEKVKDENKRLDKDNTEELTKLVKKVLLGKNWPYRRLQNAYPNVRYISRKIKEKIKR